MPELDMAFAYYCNSCWNQMLDVTIQYRMSLDAHPKRYCIICICNLHNDILIQLTLSHCLTFSTHFDILDCNQMYTHNNILASCFMWHDMSHTLPSSLSLNLVNTKPGCPEVEQKKGGHTMEEIFRFGSDRKHTTTPDNGQLVSAS